MKVREARVERIGCDGAGPAPAGRLFGSKIAAGLFCVPVVKFMGRNRLPRAAKEVILRSGKRHVAEAREFACVEAAARQHACHRAAADCLGQIHETAALGDARKPRADCLADALAHGFVPGERLRVKLRIAAAEIQPVEVLRQSVVVERAEIDEICAQTAQKI